MRICYVRYIFQEDVHEDLLCAISLSGMCVRICYVRYLYQKDVHEDLLCAISLSGGCA